MSISQQSWKNGKWLSVVIILLAFGLRLLFLDRQSLWWDEIKTVERATGTVESLLIDIVYYKRGHVPFYFLLMQLWSRIGESAFVLRYFSVVAGTVTVALLYHLGWLLGKRPLARTAAFLLAISPFHIWYSQEMRMYSFVTALAIGGTILLLYGVRHNRLRDWVLYGVVMGTAVYTHYFLLLLMFAHALFVALSFRKMQTAALRWFMAAAAVGAVFSVYVWAVVNGGGYQEATPGWIMQARWFDPFLTLLAYAAGPTIDPSSVPALLLGVLFGGGLLASFVPKEDEAGWRLTRLWLFTPWLIIFIVSLGLRPGFSLYLDRYLILILPAYLLLVSAGFLWLVQRFGQPRLVMPLLLGLLLLTLPTLQNLYSDERFARTDVRGAVQILAETAVSTDTVIGQPDVQLPLRHYAAQHHKTFVFVPLPINPTTAADEALFVEAMAAQVETAVSQNGRVWYLHQTFNRSPHGFLQPPQVVDPRAAWLGQNLIEQQRYELANVQLILYQVNE